MSTNKYRNQPLKGLYLTYQFFAVLSRIPLWILQAIPRSWRPRASWSFKRAFLVKFIRHVTDRIVPLLRSPNHRAIMHGPHVNGIWVNPVPELITGKLETWMKAASVVPIRIPGYWSYETNSAVEIGTVPLPGEKVLYHLHGGAYVLASAHPSDVFANISRGILQHSSSVHRSFALEYRLSSSKPFEMSGSFPSALIDALAGYNYLVNIVGFAPADIIIIGDSSGGNLTLALTRYLVEYRGRNNLPAPPGGILLLSPWSDLGVHGGPTGSRCTNTDSDYIKVFGDGIDYARNSFLGPFGLGVASRNPYISPASLDPGLIIDFKGFPRTFIVAGGAEVLYDEIVVLKDRIVKDLGDEVTYYEAKDAIHVYLGFELYEPERTETLRAIAEWIS